MSRLLWIVPHNSGVHVSFQITVFSGYVPKSRIDGSYCSSSFSFFKGTSIVFFILAVPIYIFTTSVISKHSLAIISLFKTLRTWLAYTRIVTTPSRNFPNNFKYKDVKDAFLILPQPYSGMLIITQNTIKLRWFFK